MKKIAVVGVLAVLLAGVAVWVVRPPAAPASMLEAPPMDEASVARGAYLARLGDCVACHTAEGGKEMAGGLEFETPMGKIYSSNITPDPKTGIGGVTLAQFEGALRRGVGADGSYLYPAMPFPAFAKISDDDVKALYAYIMKGVAPVEQANRANAMRFPFNIRLGLAPWNKAFLDSSRFVEDRSRDAQWNRGAYIVEGLGHCGTCHTPRGVAMQELTTREDGKSFLSGSTIAPWRSISLRRFTSEPEIAKLLKTGVNGHAAAFGAMTEVIANSTQYFTDEDLAATAHFLKSLAPTNAAPENAPVTVADGLYSTRGGLGYDQFCSSCHGRDGRGTPGVFPPLAGNASVLSDDPISVVHVVLTGWTEAKTKNSQHAFTMPEYSSLKDEEIAEILTFARASWGNKARPVAVAEVKTQREALAPKSTAPENYITPRYADMLASGDAVELVQGMRLMSETRALLPHNVGDQMNCSSCHINSGTMAKGSPFNGLTAQFPSLNPRAGRVITVADRLNGCFLRSMNGTKLADDSPEMRAMIAFMDWMKGDAKKGDKISGRGTTKIPDTLTPDPVRGKTLFAADCAVCHGDEGQGLKNEAGEFVFPPLWGDEAFNIGAGIARTYTAAGFVKANMPIANSRKFPQGQGGLSDQDALDIAEYFTHQTRADFPDKVKDWPNGGKPKDSRY